MALDIPALARTNVDLAWSLVDSVLTSSTLRLNPSGTYTPATDSKAVVWGSTLPNVKAFFWDDKNNPTPQGFKQDGSQGLTKMAMVRLSDIGNAEVDTSAEIDEGPITWQVSGVDTPPGGAIVILSLYR